MKVIGLDVGISSVGWSVIEEDEATGNACVKAAGTWLFDSVEEAATGGKKKLKSEGRRVYRGQRRTIRRRRQRMDAVREMFAQHGLLSSSASDCLNLGINPWEMRVAALSRRLTGEELAVALAHISKHRGFRSSARDLGSNASDETGKMKSQSADLKKAAGEFRTVGLALMSLPEYVIGTRDEDGTAVATRRLRNRSGDYTRTVMREDLSREVAIIFSEQRRLGNEFATAKLEAEYRRWVFYPGKKQDTYDLVGNCTLEPNQKRVPKAAPSFELFRFLQKLNNLSVVYGSAKRRLTPEEIGKAVSDFGRNKSFTFKNLYDVLDLDDQERIDGVSVDSVGYDICGKSVTSANLTASLRRRLIMALGTERALKAFERRELLDQAISIIVYHNDPDDVRDRLKTLGLPDDVLDVILAMLLDGEFSKLSGVGHLSSKALNAIIPHLLDGVGYYEACKRVGYDSQDSNLTRAFETDLRGNDAIRFFLRKRKIDKTLIGSPAARKAMIEALKQVKAVVEKYGEPDRFHVELARDLDKSVDEKNKITIEQDKREKSRVATRKEFEDLLGRAPSSSELIKFEHWKEQGHHCAYTNIYISPSALIDGENAVQIDHVLPWSRFADDSRANKVLCLAKANQDKGNRTPYEWFMSDKGESAWLDFVTRVETSTLKGIQKRNLLFKPDQDREQKFASRNLNDTRWGTRVLAQALEAAFSKGDGRRVVFARPGQLTNLLRHAWGLNDLKKNDKGERIQDARHHAIDAIIVGVSSEKLLQMVTARVKLMEGSDRAGRLAKMIPQPWEGFRDHVREVHEGIFVARGENRRARGQMHKETVVAAKPVADGVQIYRSVSPKVMKLADLDDFENPTRQRHLIDMLRVYIEENPLRNDKPRKVDFVLPNGDVIRKIRLLDGKPVTAEKAGISVRGGMAGNSSIVRVDVFKGEDKKGKLDWRFVPVYTHQVYQDDKPPTRSLGKKNASNNVDVSETNHRFIYSLYTGSYIKVTFGAEFISGYFVSFDINDGRFIFRNHTNGEDVRKAIIAADKIEKISVDRLGDMKKIHQEIRTWHGKRCT